ncbi:hypothetical protein LCGC14_2894020 [marine sediment metagenome]|uniref:Uncharacterized protein n=1 Tax=marine sediment metagenome TaxID=412755 RepID=A0A0F8YI71_9ZZZZ
MDLKRPIREARDQEDREALANLSFEQRSCLIMGHLVFMLDVLSSDIKAGKVTMTEADRVFLMYATSTIMKSWGSLDDFTNAFDIYCRQNPSLKDTITRMRKTSIHFMRKQNDS